MGIVVKFLKLKFIDPFLQFIHNSRAVGITLLTCTALSLILANWSVTGELYRNFFTTTFNGQEEHHLHLGILSLPNSPLLLINDLLMAVFFLLAGMEIKRELVAGELSSLKKSLLPVGGALGGMVAPAIIFLLINKGTVFANGWAIPTATDIAFTLGVASLLGDRVPVSLKIFLTALAIIDDLGAIVVIALFYGGSIQVMYLLGCLLVTAILYALNRFKVKFGTINWILGLLLWYCMFNSGIHATVAGVIFAMLVPTDILHKYELKLHAPVYFIIMPVFALANTAILFPENPIQALNCTLSWGIIFGLLIGKPLGICISCYLLVKNKLAELPNAVDWNKLTGAGLLAGIGFTMSIFISTLAFSSPAEQDIAKISVLLASVIAMIAGFVWLKFPAKKNQAKTRAINP